VFRIFTDSSARSSNLRAHSIDVEDRIPPTELQAIKHDSSLRVIKSTSIGYQGITINIGNKNGLNKTYENVGTQFAKSRDLRLAFELALDRKQINKVVFGGSQNPGCFPFPAASPYAAATKGIPCHLSANLKAARAAFSRSGAKAPVDLHLMIGVDTIAQRVGATIQDMEKKVGFNVMLDPTEFTTALNREDAGKYETFAVGWSGRVDPDGNLFNQQQSEGPLNYGGEANPAVDKGLADGRTTTDTGKRREIYRRVIATLLRDRNVIYLYHDKLFTGSRSDVSGVEVRGDGLPRVLFATVGKGGV
jgi:peptide/nickel transport system substrate-binding protein